MLDNVQTLCKVTNGVLRQGDPQQKITGIMSRCKAVKPGQVYFDVKGGPGSDENILVALDKGAVALVISKHKKKLPFNNHKISVIAVPKVWDAFWDCVSYHRDQFNIPVVGVTGTSGKTTTKEMIASIFKKKWGKILKTEQNLNLPSFVPGHIMRLTAEHKAAVFEIGMNRRGHVAKQSRVIKPMIGIITNIGQAHVGMLGSKEAVIEEKGSIIEGIPKNGYLLINADDENSGKLDLSSFQGKTLRFGIKNKADYVAEDIATGLDFVSFKTVIYGKEEQIRVPISGKHNVYNALAAIAASTLLNIEVKYIKQGLAGFRRPKLRLQLVKGINDSLLINDTYNANPDSVIAGLEVLKELAKDRTSIAVLGNMLEQGVFTNEAHQRVGRRVQELGIDYLITIGKLARQIAVGARKHGMPEEKIKSFDQRYEGSFYLKKHMPHRAVCLFKGSRAVYLDKMVEYLKDPAASPQTIQIIR
ncbi:UDP-N-acetylmuramoylalanyl-D-glutamyl-2,6-diaminopimelate/D-alanyl-D-alanyl ligase [Thermincola potens JR]|uniref:UDP-N-acetylmuramoyl-tripeptide--D-alanyl-D-alanine ligase n=2 Tax=Thermincola TaxID=278993 RepID=D5X7N8_THEPJ|nr:UDP-N-acetylmuramoylalanyl-D-glutamyl-2,6-diaminopimelate/D-alanyl-D-alanyl ligase [Thermincola potens JR]